MKSDEKLVFCQELWDLANVTLCKVLIENMSSLWKKIILLTHEIIKLHDIIMFTLHLFIPIAW